MTETYMHCHEIIAGDYFETKRLRRHFCQSLANTTPYSLTDIELAFRRLNSFDEVIEAIYSAEYRFGGSLSAGVEYVMMVNALDKWTKVIDEKVKNHQEPSGFLND